jgi:NAD(P)-dependent dehydrogenase (short-subunit alcohol dehydrogenase family)
MTDATYPDLSGKTVLVTGGATGIGEALVRAFAAQGAKVGFLDLDGGAGTRLADELRQTGAQVAFHRLDLRDVQALRDGIAQVRAALGPIGVLVNNAANDERHATEDVTPEYFDDRIAVNLKHQFFASQAVLPDMKALGGGSIICFSSIAWMAGFGGMALYNASKSAVLGLVKNLARDHGPDNIRVNGIAPGWIITQRQLDHWLTPEADAMRADRQAIKRRLLPQDMARVALFLASEASGAITSQTIIADGGWV